MSSAVLITGAGSGIGAASAVEFARRGHFVHLLGRNPKNLQKTKDLCPQSQIWVCDLADPAAVDSTARQILAGNHRPEILVNNAGIFERHSVETGSDALWVQHFETNLMGPVRLTRALWPHLRALKRGSIVNVASTLGLKPTADTGAYSALKAALVNWTHALALEGGPLGIRANCVCPGLVDTPIHAFHGQAADEKSKTMASLAHLQPLGRIGQPDEIARAIAFLATTDSAWTTGAILPVDGGIFNS